jgi:5S rRNA maturation endonuclease (ribonuclease M5)
VLGCGAGSQSDKVSTLSSRLKEKQEKILQILNALVEASAEGMPIIVEGKNDVAALRCLGVEGTIITAKTGGKSFLDVVLDVEHSGTAEVVLFLDFDRRGREGTKRLKQGFERAKIKANVGLWRALLGLVGKEVQCVEGLAAYLETLRVKIGVSAG